MLKIFRKIRQKLLSQNKYSKYLLYAFGEILLVVIGILIALQVNNWNQRRLNKIEENNIIINIHEEFKINLDKFEKTYDGAKKALNASKILSSLVGLDPSEIVLHNIDSLLFNVFEYANLSVSENTIFDLTQSGRLELLKSTDLKNHIYEWTAQKQLIHENYFLARSKSALLVQYLSSRYSIKNMDIYGPFDWQEKSRLPSDKLKIFNELEFENILEDVIYAQYIYINALGKIETTIKNVIEGTGKS